MYVYLLAHNKRTCKNGQKDIKQLTTRKNSHLNLKRQRMTKMSS